MKKQRQSCPHCGHPIEGMKWKATIVRFNISKEGIIGGAPFDTLLSVPPGTFLVQPCGHRIEPDAAEQIIADYAGSTRRTARARQKSQE